MLVAVPLDPRGSSTRASRRGGPCRTRRRGSASARRCLSRPRGRSPSGRGRPASRPGRGGCPRGSGARALLDRPAEVVATEVRPGVGGVVDRVVSAPVTLHRCRVADARGYPFRAGGVGRGGADGEHRLGQPATRCRRFRHGFARGVASIRCDRLPDRRQPRSGHPAPPSGPAGGEPPHPAVAPRVQPPARLPRHRCSGRPHRCGLAVHTDPGPVQLADAQRGRHDLRREPLRRGRPRLHDDAPPDARRRLHRLGQVRPRSSSSNPAATRCTRSSRSRTER